MEVVAVRIGNFDPERTQVDHPHQLSSADCVRVFDAAITYPGVKFEIVFGVSDSTWYVRALAAAAAAAAARP
jgi:hypothetical protein